VTQSGHCLMQFGWPDSNWQQFRLTTLLVASLRARLWVRHFLLATVYRVGQKHVSRQAPKNAVSGANVKRATNDNYARPIN
jgi:hypothetical protein